MSSAPNARIIVAGATGDLGYRTVQSLRLRGANVTAPVRRGSTTEKVKRLEAAGAVAIETDFDDATTLCGLCEGAACIVSTVNGLDPVIIGLQSKLLKAGVAAGVPRFIPSVSVVRTFGTTRGVD